MKSSEGSIRDQLSKSTDKLHETVSAIREVQSFSLQRTVIDDIETRIHDTITPASNRGAVVKGIMMGMIQLIQFLVYAFAFWIGGILIEKGRIEFGDFMQSLWAMAFAASGLGQAALFAGGKQIFTSSSWSVLPVQTLLNGAIFATRLVHRCWESKCCSGFHFQNTW